MAAVKLRHLPDELHRALCVRAAKHGRSIEAEICSILEMTVFLAQRVKLGTLMTSIASEAGGLTDKEADSFNSLRDKSLIEPF